MSTIAPQYDHLTDSVEEPDLDFDMYRLGVAAAVEAANDAIRTAWRNYRHRCAPVARSKKYEFVARVISDMEDEFVSIYDGYPQEFELVN